MFCTAGRNKQQHLPDHGKEQQRNGIRTPPATQRVPACPPACPVCPSALHLRCRCRCVQPVQCCCALHHQAGPQTQPALLLSTEPQSRTLPQGVRHRPTHEPLCTPPYVFACLGTCDALHLSIDLPFRLHMIHNPGLAADINADCQQLSF
jgi:hypothetical protein